MSSGAGASDKSGLNAARAVTSMSSTTIWWFTSVVIAARVLRRQHSVERQQRDDNYGNDGDDNGRANVSVH